jgi:ribose 5-phosphate isomerase B
MLFIASDHAGFELKEKIRERLKGHMEAEDLGVHSTEACDYPLLAKAVAEKIMSHPGSLGILICGSGIGMSIAANKFKGIRAACVSESKSAELARQHNNANILCFGARIIDIEQAMQCLNAFLNAKFDTTSPRHQKRIDQISSFE